MRYDVLDCTFVGGQEMRGFAPSTGIGSLLRKIYDFRLANKQLIYEDELKRTVQYLKPWEHQPGTAEKILEISLPNLSQASNMLELQEAYALTMQKLLHIPHDDDVIDRKIPL